MPSTAPACLPAPCCRIMQLPHYLCCPRVQALPRLSAGVRRGPVHPGERLHPRRLPCTRPPLLPQPHHAAHGAQQVGLQPVTLCNFASLSIELLLGGLQLPHKLTTHPVTLLASDCSLFWWLPLYNFSVMLLTVIYQAPFQLLLPSGHQAHGGDSKVRCSPGLQCVLDCRLLLCRN